MHRGNLSFAVPGLDNEIQGLWFMVTPTKEGEHEDEAVRTIGELFGKLQDKEGRTKGNRRPDGSSNAVVRWTLCEGQLRAKFSEGRQ